MADPSIDDDKPIQTTGTSKWLWFAVIVVLAIAAIIIFLNPSGDRDVESQVSGATQEERLDTDLQSDEQLAEDAVEQVRGVSEENTIVTDEGEVVADPVATE